MNVPRRLTRPPEPGRPPDPIDNDAARAVMDAIYAPTSAGGTFAWLEPLTRAVPCDSASVMVVDADGHLVSHVDWPTLSALEDAYRAGFHAHLPYCVFCSDPESIADNYGVARLSTVYANTGDHAATPGAAYFRRFAAQPAMAISLDSHTDTDSDMGTGKAVLVCCRAGDVFTPESQWALALLRPHLRHAYRRASSLALAAGLTDRQRDILRLAGRGDNNPRIAAVLDLSVGTVRKHLENIYTVLGVHSRVAAARAVSGAETRWGASELNQA